MRHDLEKEKLMCDKITILEIKESTYSVTLCFSDSNNILGHSFVCFISIN